MTDKFKISLFVSFLILFLAYTAHLYSNQAVEVKQLDEQVDEGKLVWQKYNCGACHQVYGLGGYLGPDLTNTYSTKGAEYIDAFLISGTNIMPKFDMTEAERRAIIAYLKSIDESGIAHPKSFKINSNGTIEQ